MPTGIFSYFGAEDPLNLEIEALEVGPKTYNALKSADIHDLRALVLLDESHLRASGFTDKMIHEVQYELAILGLSLGM